MTLLSNISFEVKRNQIVGIVGETGSGKTLTMLAVMKMLSSNISLDSGEIIFLKQNLCEKSDKEMKLIRGKEIAMIFQNQKLSFSHFYKISSQMKDIIKIKNNRMSNKLLDDLCLNSLSQVGFKDPKEIYNKYPFEISGGMAQRVLLATMMLVSPKLLIADEPTAALDPKSQNYILKLIKNHQQKFNNSIIIITHDFSVVKQICDYVVVMKAGRIVDQNTVENIIKHPSTSYTKQLIKIKEEFLK